MVSMACKTVSDSTGQRSPLKALNSNSLSLFVDFSTLLRTLNVVRLSEDFAFRITRGFVAGDEWSRRDCDGLFVLFPKSNL